MKYVLLDTNIIIDMVVDRRHQISNQLLSKFVKLLDSGEIKMIVPEIIRVETYRHLDEEFAEVGKRIEKALDIIGGLYGVSTLKVDGLDLSEYKRNARQELHNALTEFESNKDTYKKDVMETINLLFSHSNCILIDDITLIDKVVKRKYHQRAPFHKVEKESNGDGIITETLINLKKFITIEDEDIVYFVTGNYKDFADISKKGKDVLHEDILLDLKGVGLEDKVKYIRSFGMLVSKELKGSLEHVQLIEELEKELEEQQREEEELYYAEWSDLKRESAGLSSLTSFDSDVDEYLMTFREELENLNSEFSAIYDKIDEIIDFYQEECMELLSEIEIINLPNFLKKIEYIYPYYQDNTVRCFIEFMQWLSEKTAEWEKMKRSEDFSEIDFGETRSIFSVDGDEYVLYVEDKYLTLEEGSQDEVLISLTNSDEDERWNGGIYITYGFVEYDEDGGIDNALEDDICLKEDDIINQIKSLRDEWKDIINDEEVTILAIRDVIEEIQNDEES